MKLKSAVSDVFLPAKLSFFSSISQQVEQFLSEYQSDAPLLPFIQEDLVKLAMNLLRRCIKDKVIQKLANVKVWTALPLSDTSTHLSSSKVGLGFVTERIVSKLKRDKKVSKCQLLEFKAECKAILLTFCKKFFSKPLSNIPLHHICQR